jgi:DNA repair ATPase RecN
MTMLEKFISFTKDLPADQLESVEQSLAALMESLSEKYGFSAEQLIELDSRMAEEHPEYASEAEITKIFGKPFNA